MAIDSCRFSIILILACKKILSYFRNFRTLRRAIPFDDAIHAHKYVAWSIFIFMFVHIFAHIANVIHVCIPLSVRRFSRN